MDSMEEGIEKSEAPYLEIVEPEISENVSAILDDAAQDETEEINYAVLSKEELLKKLQDLMTTDDAQSVATNIRMLREAYSEMMKSATETKLNKYIEEGGEKEDFEMPQDMMDKQFEKLFAEHRKNYSTQKADKEKQLVENTANKKLIIETLREIMTTEGSINKKFQEFQALQTKWRSIGKVLPAESNNLFQSYQLCVNQFFDLMKISRELRDLDMRKNLELKIELCEKAEKLSQISSIKKALDELKNLQEKWREIGYASKEENEIVWARFKAAADAVFVRYKEQLLTIKAKQAENLEAKKALCNQVEELVAVSYNGAKEWQTANDNLNTIWAQWQKIGYVSKDDKDETWNRFKNAKNNFYKLKDAFYTSLKQEYDTNLAKKIALCEKAESIQANTDWAATANEYKRLQSDWKKIGAVARKDSDKIWKRFKLAADTFFENKNKFFAEKDAALLINHQQKLTVIDKIKALPISDDNKENLEQLKTLSEEFRSIGEVPYKMFEPLMQDYRKTVDEYFGKIKEKKGADDKSFHQLKYDQMQQTDKGKEELSKERLQLQNKIKRMQAEVMQLENNLSFFAKSKTSDGIVSEFQQKLEKEKAEIKKLQEHLKLIPVG